jgi:GrpB-like predicted nucleotidyltransferase (UPF0157 family)
LELRASRDLNLYIYWQVRLGAVHISVKNFKMRVNIEQHNPAWIVEFQKTKASLETILENIPYHKRMLVSDEELRKEYARVKMALTEQDFANIGEMQWERMKFFLGF